MAKFTNVGQVLEKKDKTGNYIKLGKDVGDEKYRYTVHVTITNSQGEVVAEATNPVITIKDPRDGLDEAKAAKVPGFIKKSLSLLEQD